MNKGAIQTEPGDSETLVRTWRGPHENLCTPRDSVHLWCQTLDVAASSNDVFYCLLSAREQQRADAFHFVSDRTHFIAAHGLLRCVLAAYLGCRAEALIFDFGPNGKPHLRHSGGGLPLEFNLSHSRGMLLLAISAGTPVGVDIEGLREDASLLSVAEQYFHADEFLHLKALSGDLRRDAFFRCWTYKEAAVKYCGEGLRRPIHTIPAPKGLMEGDDTWHTSLVDGLPMMVKSLRPVPNFIGALAVKRTIRCIERWNWSAPLALV
ncbi:MAG: 4'-phosphopantetheinyl transferase family protein [Gammaproteobacteria bacterium]